MTTRKRRKRRPRATPGDLKLFAAAMVLLGNEIAARGAGGGYLDVAATPPPEGEDEPRRDG